MPHYEELDKEAVLLVKKYAVHLEFDATCYCALIKSFP